MLPWSQSSTGRSAQRFARPSTRHLPHRPRHLSPGTRRPRTPWRGRLVEASGSACSRGVGLDSVACRPATSPSTTTRCASTPQAQESMAPAARQAAARRPRSSLATCANRQHSGSVGHLVHHRRHAAATAGSAPEDCHARGRSVATRISDHCKCGKSALQARALPVRRERAPMINSEAPAADDSRRPCTSPARRCNL